MAADLARARAAAGGEPGRAQVVHYDCMPFLGLIGPRNVKLETR